MKPLRNRPVIPDKVSTELHPVAIPVVVDAQNNNLSNEDLNPMLNITRDPTPVHTYLTNTVNVYDTHKQTIHLSGFDIGKGFILYPSQRALIPIKEVFDYDVTLTSHSEIACSKGLCVLGNSIFKANEKIVVPIINLSKERQVILDSDLIAMII